MDPHGKRPNNVSTDVSHFKISLSLHRIEDSSSGALSTGAAPVWISIIDSWPVITAIFHPDPQLTHSFDTIYQWNK